MKRIADLRPVIKDLDEAKQIMAEIAQLECQIAYADALLEKQVVAAKERHGERVDPHLERLNQVHNSLKNFIMNNRQLFKKPRKIATEFGSFGLQDVSELIVSNEETLIEHCLEQGYTECVKTVQKPVKSEIKKRLKDGEQIPGCSLVEGDTAVYKVAKALIDEATDKVS